MSRDVTRSVYKRNVFFTKQRRARRLDTDNTSVCIHPVIDAKGAYGTVRQRLDKVL